MIATSFSDVFCQKFHDFLKKRLTRGCFHVIIGVPLEIGSFKCARNREPPRVSASLREREVLFVFAVIETGGKQYKVVEQDIVFVEKLDVNEGDEIVFDQVLAVSNDAGFRAGTPVVDGAKVTAKVLKNGKGKKIYVIKYKAKKNEKKKIGHRQPYTKVQILKIEG